MSGVADQNISENVDDSLQNITLRTTLPEDEEEDPAALLKRSLSTKSVVSTTSSFAERIQEASRKAGFEKSVFRNIGLGSCGSVFEVPGTELAYKKGSNEADIFRDFQLTKKVYKAAADVREALQAAFPKLKVPKTPKCYDYHDVSDAQFWNDNLQRFPVGHRNKQAIFAVDHILPLPKDLREAFIELYFDDDEEIQQEAREDPDNKDCLIRLYFGERESGCPDYDSLRNFPLRLNMMEDLDLETDILANEMALGLAVMHWQAQVDAMDVEFVLASSATWVQSPLTPSDAAETINFQRRQIDMWLFDFDKASEFELTKADVKKRLIPAFLGNDPYYTRPNVDQDLWDKFSATYLQASELILRNRGIDQSQKILPRYFLEEVSKMLKENEDWTEERNIVFAN